MLFWTTRVSLGSLHCVECVASLLKWKLRGVTEYSLPQCIASLKKKQTCLLRTMSIPWNPRRQIFFFSPFLKKYFYETLLRFSVPGGRAKGLLTRIIQQMPCSGHEGCNWLASTFWSWKRETWTDAAVSHGSPHPLLFYLCLPFSLLF